MKVIWESLSTSHAASARVLAFSVQRFDGPLHAHDALELTWIESGRGMRFIGDSVEAFGPGDLVLVAPRVAHAWRSHGRQSRESRARVLQIATQGALCALPEWQQCVEPLLALDAAGWVVEGELGAQICAELTRLSDKDPLSRLGDALALLSQLVTAIRAPAGRIRTVGHRPSTASEIGSAGHKRVDQLLDWIRRHLHRPIRAKDAARILHVTPAAFSRAFKRLVGKSFSLYVNDLRVAEACLALGRSDRPIARIATQCGFGTLSNFNVQFRRRLGMTPRAYRSGHVAAMDFGRARGKIRL
jgi:AraC-like DNA-binding protein